MKATLKVLGADIGEEHRVLSIREELRGAIELGHKEAALVKEERDMAGRHPRP